MVSVFLSQLMFAVVILMWAGQAWSRRRLGLKAPPFFPVLLVFVAAVLIAVISSTDVVQSSVYLKKLLKLFYALFFFTFLTREDIEWTLKGIFILLGASALLGVLQYYWLMDVTLLNRIEGFMSHWMTFSGQLMLVSVALSGYILLQARFGWCRAFPWSLLLGLLLFALVLTLTRSALVGAVVGLLVIAAFYRPKWLFPAGAALVMIFLVLPASFKERFYSSFDLKDVTTQGRLEYVYTGTRVISEHPITGLGPRMFSRLYDEYRASSDLPDWAYQHLHNNFIQIAAEMGLLAFFAWAALWGRIYWDLFRFARSAEDPFAIYLSVNGMGVLTAFLFAGLFEYNFGDSELLILLLFFVTVPYAVNLRQTTPA